MAQRFRLSLSGYLSVVVFLLALAPQLAAQATLEFRRIEVNWPNVDLVFVTRCDTTVVHPADAADVHVLEDGVVRHPDPLIRSGEETIARISGTCPNGGVHRVQLAVTLSCGTTATRSLNYTAPYDPDSFRSLRIVPDQLMLPAGGKGRLPVRLLDPVLGPHVQTYRVLLSFDSSVARATGISAPAGTLLEGATLTFTSGALPELGFPSPGPMHQQDTGILFYIEFDAPPRTDTACTQLSFLPRTSVVDPANCTRLSLSDASLCASPPFPRLVCESSDAPDTLRWNSLTGAYEPAPFVFRPVLRNIGTGEARTPVFRLTWNPEALVLQAGFPDTVIARPSRVDPGGTCFAEWRFAVRERTELEYVTRVETIVEYLGGETATCGKNVVLLRKPFPALECTANAPAIAWSESLNRYVPMPLPLTVDVNNTGAGATDTVFVEVELPDGLSLVRGEQERKTLTPLVLGPFSGGNAEWMLQHERTSSEKVYTVVVRSWSDNAPMATCTTTVTIPAAGEGMFAFSLTASGPLAFCDGDSVVLDGGEGYAEWLWSNGHRERLLNVTASGLYWCEVRDGTGRSGLSDTLLVTAHPLPPVPGVVRDGDVLRATAAPGIGRQWYRDGWPLAGETADTLRLPDTGVYTIRVYSEENCESESLPLDVTVLSAGGTAVADLFQLRTWPEPASGQITVEALVPPGRRVTLRLTDMLGRSVLLYDGVPAGGRLVLPVSLTGRAAGTWLLALSGEGMVVMRRVTRL